MGWMGCELKIYVTEEFGNLFLTPNFYPHVRNMKPTKGLAI